MCTICSQMVGRGGSKTVRGTNTGEKTLRELPLCGRTDYELSSFVLWVILGFLNFLPITCTIGVMTKKNILNTNMINVIHFSNTHPSDKNCYLFHNVPWDLMSSRTWKKPGEYNVIPGTGNFLWHYDNGHYYVLCLLPHCSCHHWGHHNTGKGAQNRLTPFALWHSTSGTPELGEKRRRRKQEDQGFKTLGPWISNISLS